MWEPLKRRLRKVEVRRHKKKVEDALALNRRGEGRRDGLTLEAVCQRVDVRWRARRLHPWDRNLPSSERELAFEQQTLTDIEAAILRLFERLPHIDALQICVLGPKSETAIVEGTVHRSDLAEVRPLLSVGMRLRDLGLRYRFFQPEERHSATATAEETAAGERGAGEHEAGERAPFNLAHDR